MLPRSAIAPLVPLALLVASPWNCSSHEAILILPPPDAGASADAPSTTTKTETSSGPDATTSDATETAARDATDTATSVPTDSVASDATDTATSPPADATASAGLPFRDDFSGGWQDNWTLSASTDGPVSDTVDGNNAIVTFDATDHSYSRLRCNRDGSLFSDIDVTASMRFRVDQAPTSTQLVRLDVRQAKNTENIFYAVGATVYKDGSITRVGIYKKVDKNVEAGPSEYTICSLAENRLSTPVPMGQWRTIRLTVLTVDANDPPTVHLEASFEDDAGVVATTSTDDDCVSDLTATDGAEVPNGGCLANQTGLGIQVEAGIKASVDDVLVTAP